MLGVDSRNYHPNGTQTPEALDGLRMLAEVFQSIETTLANYAPVIYEQNCKAFCMIFPLRRTEDWLNASGR